jgi:hypothetical protein
MAQRELSESEREVALAGRLPAVVRGEEKPRDAAERLQFGLLCYDLKQFATAARLMAETLQADPRFAEDRRSQNRYNAACAAALAAAGEGKDDPPLDDSAKARWRKQALECLRADLAAWKKLLEAGALQARPHVAQTFKHWKVDPDLASLRHPAALSKERKAWRALWDEVDRVVEKAAAK